MKGRDRLGSRSYGWQLPLRYVAGLDQEGCGIQGIHCDLGAEHSERAGGLLFLWPISEYRDTRVWEHGQKVIRRLGRLQEERPELKGDRPDESSLARSILRREGVPNLGRELGPLETLPWVDH